MSSVNSSSRSVFNKECFKSIPLVHITSIMPEKKGEELMLKCGARRYLEEKKDIIESLCDVPYRGTLHFSLGRVVSEHILMFSNGKRDDCYDRDIGIVVPTKELSKRNILSGEVDDIYPLGSFILPNGSVLFIPESRKEEFKKLGNVIYEVNYYNKKKQTIREYIKNYFEQNNFKVLRPVNGVVRVSLDKWLGFASTIFSSEMPLLYKELFNRLREKDDKEYNDFINLPEEKKGHLILKNDNPSIYLYYSKDEVDLENGMDRLSKENFHYIKKVVLKFRYEDGLRTLSRSSIDFTITPKWVEFNNNYFIRPTAKENL